MPAELESIPCTGFDFTPALLTYLIRETKWPRVLPVFSGRIITFSNIITTDTPSRIVVTMPVSDSIMTTAAISTPKFQAKFTNQLIVLSSLLAKSNPAGNPAGRDSLDFLSLFAAGVVAGIAGLALDATFAAAGFALATALAAGLALATAFATGLSFGLAPPALSNNPIFSLSLIHFSD